MVNEIDVIIGGFDTGRTPYVQQYDAGSRKYLWHLWERPGVPFEMDEDAIVGVIFDWKGSPPSHEYKADMVDRSTVMVTVPAAATQRVGPVDMQLAIHQDGGVLHSPVICFMAMRSLTAADEETDEPVMLTDWLLTKAKETAARVEQMQIDASGLAGDSNKLSGKPAEYYLPAVNLLDNSDFRNPVNQRNILSASAWDYLLDRWLAYTYDSSITTNEDGLTLDTGMLVQRVPIAKFRDGTAYTIALYYADGTVSVGNGTVDFDYLEQAHDFFYSTDYACALSVRGVATFLDFSLIVTDKAIRAAVLYEGAYTAETLPPYVPKGYGVELAECWQRYVRYGISTSRTAFIGASNGSSILMSVVLPVPMPGTSQPTLSWNGLKAYPFESGGAVNITSISSILLADRKTLQLQITPETVFDAKTPVTLYGTENGYLDISLDL